MRRSAFTLVELVVVVAIIGVLSAIAVPAWTVAQLRAKRAEVPPNVEGMKIAELAYFAANDTFADEASWYPAALTGTSADKAPRAWPALSAAGGFTEIGWGPNGEVRGSYAIPYGDTTGFEVQGTCDLDADGDTPLYWCSESAACGWDAGDETVY